MDPNRLFGDNDYDDGEFHELIPGSVLEQAIRTEPWLNHSPDFRRRWLRLINGPSATFVGAIISERRRQVELLVMIRLDQPPQRWSCNVVITLADFDRFLGPQAA